MPNATTPVPTPAPKPSTKRETVETFYGYSAYSQACEGAMLLRALGLRAGAKICGGSLTGAAKMAAVYVITEAR